MPFERPFTRYAVISVTGFDIDLDYAFQVLDLVHGGMPLWRTPAQIMEVLKQESLRSDNGPTLVSKAVQSWLKAKHVDTHYIDPGSPWQNACNESFNSIFRSTCLDR